MSIKTIIDNSYKAVLDTNRNIIKGDFSRNSYVDFNFELSYNRKGSIVKKKSTYFQPTRDLLDAYEYDSNNNEISHISFNADESVNSTTSKKYNKNNSIVQILTTGRIETETKFHYGEDQKLKKTEEYQENVLITYETTEYQDDVKIIKRYSSKNHLMWSSIVSPKNEETTHFNKDNTINCIIKIAFNDKGNRELYHRESYTSGGTYSDRTVYHYNDRGDIEVKTEYLGEEIKNLHRFMYQYDKFDNFTECIEYINNIPRFIVERKIVYFEG